MHNIFEMSTSFDEFMPIETHLVRIVEILSWKLWSIYKCLETKPFRSKFLNLIRVLSIIKNSARK